jgi:hypothetical protein
MKQMTQKSNHLGEISVAGAKAIGDYCGGYPLRHS